MTAPPAPLGSNDVKKTQEELRASDLGPALKRERLLQRVRAARKRLPGTPGRLASLR